jgi:hypothetical protein
MNDIGNNYGIREANGNKKGIKKEQKGNEITLALTIFHDLVFL